MANTITQRTLLGASHDKDIYRLINIASDGTEESDLVIYDNSTLVDSVSAGSLMQVWASGSSCQCTLEWDQSTDSPICSFDPAYTQYLDLRSFGGVTNPGATGATGDVVLTTANLDSGDVVTLILHIKQHD